LAWCIIGSLVDQHEEGKGLLSNESLIRSIIDEEDDVQIRGIRGIVNGEVKVKQFSQEEIGVNLDQLVGDRTETETGFTTSCGISPSHL
jgi:protein-arginine kinase